MSNVLRLTYSVENEKAETDTKSFALILQKAYEQYRKLWNKYLDLVKKCEVDSSVHNEIQETWKEKNVFKPINPFAEDNEFLNNSADQENQLSINKEIEDRKESQSFIDNISESSLFDLMMDVNDTICQFQPKITNAILPESPIFMRKDERSNNLENEISKNSNDKSILDKMETSNKSDCNNQNTSKNTFCIATPEENLDDTSLDNLSPFIIQSTPVINNKVNKKNKKKLFEKARQPQSNDNEVSPKKKQTKKSKIPLQALDNIANPLSTYLIHSNGDQINNKIGNNKSKLYKSCSTPNKNLKQSKLSFYNTKQNVNNATVPFINENIPVTRFKKSLYNHEPSLEDTIKENQTTMDEKINGICLDDANDQNETIFEDVIANSPDYQKVQLQNKNQLKLKRKSKMTNTITASASSTNNSKQMQNNVCPTKKRNIAINDNSILSPEMVNDNAKKKCLIFSKDIESEKKLVDKNNSERIACIKQKESNELNEFQCRLENETYFEEKTPEKKTTHVNKVINKNSLRLGNTGINSVKCNNKSKSANKDIEMKNKKWSCSECEEYYKSEAGITDTQIQRRKNQCSRHKNVYYARNATPPGFWDPFLPETASDSIYQK
ncbi:PREDICTED: uncharacterized protein DDB_G0286591-like isoform X2 [Polistes dominula]|uniref:Uncharacterized protein DDB_G0286591-like isoform X2 n=1 Tax=Polistes dominula TaxID=743375 RepID=A0ABM1IAD7_POLDO|nr:PREDICTED: uncharacterized protein DDB_G0286591-like isoform X2 [Polistes dominula]